MTQADWNVLDQALQHMSPGETELIERTRVRCGMPPDTSLVNANEAIQ